MSRVHVAILEPIDYLDDVRYEHHLKHRGQANHRIFWIFWWIIAAAFALKLASRTYLWWSRRIHRTHRYERLNTINSAGRFARVKAILAVAKLYPLPQFFGHILSTLPLSRAIILTLYTTVTLYLLTLVDAPLLSDHFLDDVAFRAAWVTLTQIPLVYLLSAKCAPIRIITGISHERVNWAHRWVGRAILVSATIHAAIMMSSISTTEILESHDEAMAVVRYGIATYTMLIWVALTSILPLRRWSHRLFYLNHYMSTIFLLFVVFQHVPTYARMAICFAGSILALDKSLVAFFFFYNNISAGYPTRRFARLRNRGKLVMGYPVQMVTPSAAISCLPNQTIDNTTVIRVINIPFTWRPGQHVRIYIPALGRFEMHPFTPANCSATQPPPLPPRRDLEPGRRVEQPRQTSEMIFMIKSKSGFTRRLEKYRRTWLARPCPNATEPVDKTLRAYIDGPYGLPPHWEEYENLVLIASSTGVSFNLAILDHLEQLCFTAGVEGIKTQSIKFIWMIRHLDPAFEEVVRGIVARCISTLRDCGIIITAEFWRTCADSRIQENETIRFDPFAHLRPQSPRRISDRPALRIRHPDEIYDEWDREAEMEEMGLKSADVEPFVTELDGYESEEETVSEQGTLNDEESDAWEDDGNPFPNTVVLANDDAYRPLPTPRRQTPKKADEPPACQCALIQHERRKFNEATRNLGPITQRYGSRPDVQRMLEQISASRSDATMVAVCANSEVTRQIQTVTARFNKDFALGRRKGRVHVHIEGQN